MKNKPLVVTGPGGSYRRITWPKDSAASHKDVIQGGAPKRITLDWLDLTAIVIWSLIIGRILL